MKPLCLLVTVSAFTILALGLWIPFKVLVVQELLGLAWAESQARQQQVRPWPVARLTFQYAGSGQHHDMANETQRSLIVLNGAHGESLALGPGTP